MVVILPPLIAVVPAASVVMLLSFSSAVALPTAPPRVVVPLSLTSKLRLAPLDTSVLARVTPTPVSMVLAPRVTASLKVCAPVVVMLPPLMAVVPAASVVRLLSFSPAVALPTAPPRVVVPLSLRLKLRAVPSDLTVVLKVTPTPLIVVSAPSVTGPV